MIDLDSIPTNDYRELIPLWFDKWAKDVTGLVLTILKDHHFRDPIEDFFEGLVNFIDELGIFMDRWSNMPIHHTRCSDPFEVHHHI